MKPYFRLLCVALALGAQSTPAAEPPSTELLLVEIYLNGKPLADFQDVLLGASGQLWLPIEPLIQAAEGTFNPTSPTAVALSLGETSAFIELDLSSQTLWLDRQPAPWPEHGILTQFEQLFMADPFLQEWLGLSARLSANQLTVHVNSQRPLPADLRRMRERRWARFDQPNFRIDPSYVAISEPYSLWGTPRGNVALSTQLGTQQNQLNPRYSASLDVEAARLSNRLFLSGDVASGLQALRWTAGRRSPEGNVFGIEALRAVSFGDVGGLRLPLQMAGGNGRGMVFSTAPTERPELFDITTISGDAIPGWDVELYRGNELIDFIRVDATGAYHFADLPIGFGNNDYRVVLYGPQGQQEERVFRNRVASGQLAPNELHVRGSVVNTGTRVFALQQANPTGGGLVNLRADYGVSTDLTMGAFVAFEQVPERRLSQLRTLFSEPLPEAANILRAHYGLSIRPRIAQADTELVVVTQDGREMAFQANARGPIGSSNAAVAYQQYSERFISTDRQQSGGLINSRWRLRSNHSLEGLGSVTLGYERAALNSGRVRQVFSPQFRHRWARVAIAHEVDYIWQAQSEQLRYRLLASWRRYDWTTRAQLSAAGTNLGDIQTQALSGSAEYRIDERQLVGVSANYNLHSGRLISNARYAFSQNVYPGRLSFSTGLSSEGSWLATVGFNIGLGADANRPVRVLPHNNTGGGGFSMRIFEDRNQSGVFDPQFDVPVAGASVLVNNRPSEARSDDSGWLIVAGLPTERRVAIALDPNSLADPFLVAAQPRVQFLPRPGFTHHVDMPLLDSGFASGTVTRFGRPVGGFEVVAERAGTGTREATFSLSDGYFSFDTLAPGTWLIQINPNTLPEGWRSTEHTIEVVEGFGVDGLQLTVHPEGDTP